MNVERRFFFHFDQRLSLLFKFYNISSSIWQNKFINHSHTRISCCYLILYLLLFSGFFWHIDSLHYDANFTLNGDRNNCKYKSLNIISCMYISFYFILRYWISIYFCLLLYLINQQIAGKMLVFHLCLGQMVNLVTTTVILHMNLSLQYYNLWRQKWEITLTSYYGLGK